ncbi:MAG: ribonuclease PH, partial [Legionellales bacterium]|nr:ribonuclease PH [Legionellales bacterium]
LDYKEDSSADTDMNVIMTSSGQYVEIQGTAEGDDFSHEQLFEMLENAKNGINKLISLQQEAI